MSQLLVGVIAKTWQNKIKLNLTEDYLIIFIGEAPGGYLGSLENCVQEWLIKKSTFWLHLSAAAMSG